MDPTADLERSEGVRDSSSQVLHLITESAMVLGNAKLEAAASKNPWF